MSPQIERDYWRDLALEAILANIERRLPEGDSARALVTKARKGLRGNFGADATANAPADTSRPSLTEVITTKPVKLPKVDDSPGPRKRVWTPEQREKMRQTIAARKAGKAQEVAS